MADADPNQALIAARTNLKDTAKWIVTIIGATIVVVIGGGLIAKIADLDWIPRLVAAGSLLVLTVVCLIPLRAAIDIVAVRLVSFRSIVVSPDYAETRRIVNDWMAKYYPPLIGTVEKLDAEYVRQTGIANSAQTALNALQGNQAPEALQQANQAHDVLQQANQALDGLQPRIREVIELSNTEFLRLKFERLVCAATVVLPFIGAALFIFLISTHRDDQTEKQLAKPVVMQIAWSADVEAALQKAGLDPKCYAPDRPKLVQLSEKSGLRAGVLVVPKDLGPCPAVRFIVTNANEVLPDN